MSTQKKQQRGKKRGEEIKRSSKQRAVSRISRGAVMYTAGVCMVAAIALAIALGLGLEIGIADSMTNVASRNAGACAGAYVGIGVGAGAGVVAMLDQTVIDIGVGVVCPLRETDLRLQPDHRNLRRSSHDDQL